MKRKIGTTLEEEVYDELKRRAADERQPIGAVIQTAVVDYLHRPKSRALPKSGLRRFLARKPFKLTPQQFKENMEADFYNQLNLDDIPDDEAVFVDANILIYAAQAQSVQCRQLLQRIDSKTVRGVCTSVVVAELCHRSMLNEARAKQLISGSNPAKALSQRRDLISQLSEYAEIVRDILNSELAVEPVQPGDLTLALELQRLHGLLTNDSMHLAVAKRLGVHGIATADSSFENVPGIIIYKPTDLVT